MPVAAAIPGLVGIGTSIAGGLAQRNAANQAGQILSNAGNAAADNQSAVGNAAADSITAAGNNAASTLMGVGQNVSNNILGAGAQGQQTLQTALQGLSPYTQGGAAAFNQLQAGLAEGGNLRQAAFQFDPAQFLNDPGVQYRIEQGRKALEAGAAARGMIGGNLGQAVTQMGQGIASDEFNQAFQRSLSAYGANAANNQQAINGLQNLSGMGLQATGQGIQGAGTMANIGLQSNIAAGDAMQGAAQGAGAFNLGAAGQAGQLRSNNAAIANGFRTDGASGLASARMGGANALSNALGGVSQGVSSIDWGRVFGRQQRPGGAGPVSI